MEKKEILEIYKEFHVPPHIIAHMRMVAHVAKKIAEKIANQGHQIDQKSITEAALLHDVIRYVDFKTLDPKSFPQKPSKSDLQFWQKAWKKYHKIGHELGMAKILKLKGEKKLASLIAKHGFFSVWKLKTIEEKILYYADKRVDKDKIVNLAKRFKEGKKRNMSPTDDKKLVAKTEAKIKELEQELTRLSGERIDQL